MFPQEKWIVGDDRDEVPPVPMPNTEVKLTFAEDTWRVTARENRVLPTPLNRESVCFLYLSYSSIAQSVEHAAVNRRVVGSSPTGGAKKTLVRKNKSFFSYIRLRRVILLRSDI